MRYIHILTSPAFCKDDYGSAKFERQWWKFEDCCSFLLMILVLERKVLGSYLVRKNVFIHSVEQ